MFIGHHQNLQYFCCGIMDNTDWIPVLGDFPTSCECDYTAYANCVLVAPDKGVYYNGCYRELWPMLRTAVDAMGGITIAISFLDVRFG